jgi:predicted DNA-binding protein with PD1-like motif
MQFTQAALGRIFIVRLHDKDRIRDTLENFAESQNIQSALCFFLGGANEKSHIVVGPKDCNASPVEPMTTLLKGVHEGVGVGTIFVNEAGKPKLHMHASFGRQEEARTGCVRAGVDVWQVGEVVVLELSGSSARRVADEKTGFELLEVTK